MTARFDGVDARFDKVDARFDAMMAATAQQFELMQQRSDQRFAELIGALNVRFDLIDRRFDEVDRRFDAVDRRFDVERALVAGQFEAQQKHIDGRFDDLRTSLHIRFTCIDGRLTALEGRD